MNILPGDFNDRQTLDLIRFHLEGMHENSPPGSVFALDLSGLRSPDVDLYAAWDGGQLCGIGALKRLSAETGEIKSMRTHPEHLRRGVAVLLLEHILTQARMRGYRRLSLETGSGPAFEPALALYRNNGFRNGPAFADYQPSEFSQFLHLDLSPPG